MNVRYEVKPAAGGWAVEAGDGGETLMFLRGARAEAHARRLAMASWDQGRAAVVVVYDAHGQFIGKWNYGAPPQADALQMEGLEDRSVR